LGSKRARKGTRMHAQWPRRKPSSNSTRLKDSNISSISSPSDDDAHGDNPCPQDDSYHVVSNQYLNDDQLPTRYAPKLRQKTFTTPPPRQEYWDGLPPSLPFDKEYSTRSPEYWLRRDISVAPWDKEEYGACSPPLESCYDGDRSN
jgi:hypothetical protein